MRQCTLLFCAVVTATAALAAGCRHGHVEKLPPPQMLMEPGPGVGGPGPGVMLNDLPVMAPLGVSQLAFLGPPGMWVTWDAGGQGLFDSEPLVAPGRQNFMQGGIYRLKLTNIPARAGWELYPTVEIAPTTPRTEAYLAHNFIPIQLTEEDLDQVAAGNFVTKVIYLPDAEYQELALAGIETLVSTRLDPGVDPITEADRRGSILCILRIGNKDLEIPGAPGGGASLGPARQGIMPVGYYGEDGGCVGCQTGAHGGGFGGGPMPQPILGMNPSYVAGITAPQYGMPITGTPIGLPGPPHIPLGVPAGLQKHVIANHTSVHMPHPVKKMKIDVQEHPGYSYPKPVSHVRIEEYEKGGGHKPYKQPWWERVRRTCGL